MEKTPNLFSSAFFGYRSTKTLFFAVGTIATFSFAAGSAVGGYVGLPAAVESLSADTRGLACMLVAMQEGIDGKYCELLLSEDTKGFISSIRHQAPAVPLPQVPNRVSSYPWVSPKMLPQEELEDGLE
jgi:hypothetical protein